jgi:hypothetical protein
MDLKSLGQENRDSTKPKRGEKKNLLSQSRSSYTSEVFLLIEILNVEDLSRRHTESNTGSGVQLQVILRRKELSEKQDEGYRICVIVMHSYSGLSQLESLKKWSFLALLQ